MHIEHLDGGHFFQNAARCESGSGLLELKPEGDMQAIGEEVNEDVRFDAIIFLVIDWPDGEIALDILEGFLDLGQLHVIAPERFRALFDQVAAQQVAFVLTHASAVVFEVQLEGEAASVGIVFDRRDLDIEQSPDFLCGFLFGLPEFEH